MIFLSRVEILYLFLASCSSSTCIEELEAVEFLAHDLVQPSSDTDLRMNCYSGWQKYLEKVSDISFHTIRAPCFSRIYVLPPAVPSRSAQVHPSGQPAEGRPQATENRPLPDSSICPKIAYAYAVLLYVGDTRRTHTTLSNQKAITLFKRGKVERCDLH